MPPPPRRNTPDVYVEGADAFDALARRLREAGQGGLVRELQKSLRQAMTPVTPATRAEARQRLPKRGGLAARVARAPQTKTARAGRTTTSLRVSVRGRRSGAAGADRGQVRHPVFGNRNEWVTQQVRPGWFTDTVEAQRPAMQAAVVDVLVDYAQRLARPL